MTTIPLNINKIIIGAILLKLCGTCYAIDTYAKATTTSSQTGFSTPDLYFGMHFHSLAGDSKHINSNVTKWPSNTLISTIRLWDTGTRWADIEPTSGVWDFNRMDIFVDQATIHKASVLYVLGSTPIWASARPDEKCPYGKGCAAEPVNMKDWENYVHTVAQRYKGKISAYELWNEPFFSELFPRTRPSSFYTGSVLLMVEMARIARNVLDQIDPSVVLTTPGFTGSSRQLELFLNSGGKQYVQVINSHFYAADTDTLARAVADVQEVMVRQGLQALPHWNTEWGYLPSFNFSAKDASFKMAQCLFFSVSAGIQRNYYYAWEDGGMPGLSSSSDPNLPALQAYQKAQTWLLGVTKFGCQSYSNGAVVCNGIQSEQHFIIAWSDLSGSTSKILLPIGQKAVSTEKLTDIMPTPIIPSVEALGLNVGLEPVKILMKSHQVH